LKKQKNDKIISRKAAKIAKQMKQINTVESWAERKNQGNGQSNPHAKLPGQKAPRTSARAPRKYK